MFQELIVRRWTTVPLNLVVTRVNVTPWMMVTNVTVYLVTKETPVWKMSTNVWKMQISVKMVERVTIDQGHTCKISLRLLI